MPVVVRELSEEKLKEAALRHLERFSTSVAHLRGVLLRRVRRRTEDEAERAQAIEAIDRIVNRFGEVGLLDDRAYAERRAEVMHRQGKPVRAMRAELLGKGVPRRITDEVLRSFEQKIGDPDLSAAIAYAKKRRLGPFRSENREEHRNKDATKLLRRGFDWDVVERVMRSAAGGQ
jgi:regulatory protein